MEVAAIVVQWGKLVNKSYNLLMILTQCHPTIIVIVIIIIVIISSLTIIIILTDLTIAIVIICPSHLHAKVSRNGWSWVWRVILTTH